MMNPPLHNFMNSLFSGPAFVHGQGKVQCEAKESDAFDDFVSVQCVTKIVCKLSSIDQDCQINIVQDNACVHAKAPLFPYHHSHHHQGVKGGHCGRDLDLSNSETRFLSDTSAERVEETSRQPRRPRRRLSVDFGHSNFISPEEAQLHVATAAAARQNNNSSNNNKAKCNSIPKRPLRKATLEFASPPAAAPARVAKIAACIDSKKKAIGEGAPGNTAPSPPRIPQRRGTMDLGGPYVPQGTPTTTTTTNTEPTTDRRLSATLDGSAHGPKFPQRRGSNDYNNSSNGSFSEGDLPRRYSRSERVRNNAVQNNAANATGAPTRPQRRSSLLCTPSTAPVVAVLDETQRRSSCPEIFSSG
ncbi:expressed unknown protein [Seminavis robusta]|uniref:Uncharacterized protein n=1 Tax=Seminavis robusta TaxID=568900 RepID=A0A9N8F1N8_9STRA|nr:expressed unknown protein [Seminavis robusta]|eukprot:Sro2367_g325060.1 n/a (358) ;mRNA; f:2942-4015